MLPPNVQMSHSRAREHVTRHHHVTRDIHCRIYIVTRLCSSQYLYLSSQNEARARALPQCVTVSASPPSLSTGAHTDALLGRVCPHPALLAAGACAHHVIHVIWTGSTSTSHSTVCIMCNSQQILHCQ